MCLDTGKHSPGGTVAFFPTHTEIQYGLAAGPFSLQRHIRILNSIKVVVKSLSKRKRRGLCFANLVTMTCGNRLNFFFTCCSFCLNAFALDMHMASSFSDLLEVFAQLLPSPLP